MVINRLWKTIRNIPFLLSGLNSSGQNRDTAARQTKPAQATPFLSCASLRLPSTFPPLNEEYH